MGSVDGDAYLDGAETRRGIRAIIRGVRKLRIRNDDRSYRPPARRHGAEDGREPWVREWMAVVRERGGREAPARARARRMGDRILRHALDVGPGGRGRRAGGRGRPGAPP